jgi:hypothetical protein
MKAQGRCGVSDGLMGKPQLARLFRVTLRVGQSAHPLSHFLSEEAVFPAGRGGYILCSNFSGGAVGQPASQVLGLHLREGALGRPASQALCLQPQRRASWSTRKPSTCLARALGRSASQAFWLLTDPQRPTRKGRPAKPKCSTPESFACFTSAKYSCRSAFTGRPKCLAKAKHLA